MPPGGHGRTREGLRGRPRLRRLQRPRDGGAAGGDGGRRGRGTRTRRVDGGLRGGPVHLRAARNGTPRAASGRGPDGGPVRTPLPRLRSRARAGSGRRGRADGPAQRVRDDEARPGAPGGELGPVRGGPCGVAALPQRVRAGHAARHPVRRGGLLLPFRARPGRGPPGLRGRRPAEGLRPCGGRGGGQRGGARSGRRRAGGRARRVQHRQRGAAHGRRDGRRAGLGPRRARPGGYGRVPPRRRTAHHRRLRPAARGAGLASVVGFAEGMAGFARAGQRESAGAIG